MIPGTMPAINISPIEHLTCTPYRIIRMLGGIRAARLLALTIRPRLNVSLYPALSNFGYIAPPIAATVAAVEPEIAPNTAQLPTAV